MPKLFIKKAAYEEEQAEMRKVINHNFASQNRKIAQLTERLRKLEEHVTRTTELQTQAMQLLYGNKETSTESRTNMDIKNAGSYRHKREDKVHQDPSSIQESVSS